MDPRPAPVGHRARQRDLGIVAACTCVVIAAAAAQTGRDGVASFSQPTTLVVAVPPPLPPGASAPSPVVPSDVGCSFTDPGFGVFERWRPLPALAGTGARARLLLPRTAVGDVLAVLVHFHGADAVRKVLVAASPETTGDAATAPLAVVGVDAGTRSSHYERAMVEPATLGALVDAVARAASDAWSRAVRVERFAISSWSAGYGAVAVCLREPDPRLGAVVLLDSLHASYDASGHGIAAGALEPFERFARSAADGGPSLYVTHTQIQPDGYASTRETAEALLRATAGERGRFHVRSAPGTDAESHCDQLRLLGDIVPSFVRPALR